MTVRSQHPLGTQTTAIGVPVLTGSRPAAVAESCSGYGVVLWWSGPAPGPFRDHGVVRRQDAIGWPFSMSARCSVYLVYTYGDELASQRAIAIRFDGLPARTLTK